MYSYNKRVLSVCFIGNSREKYACGPKKLNEQHHQARPASADWSCLASECFILLSLTYILILKYPSKLFRFLRFKTLRLKLHCKCFLLFSKWSYCILNSFLLYELCTVSYCRFCFHSIFTVFSIVHYCTSCLQYVTVEFQCILANYYCKSKYGNRNWLKKQPQIWLERHFSRWISVMLSQLRCILVLT